MKITLTNIGKISLAEVNLNGLTVIAGPNDSGKSTLGKALFVTVSAYQKVMATDANLVAFNIERIFRDLYSKLGTERFINPILSKHLPTLTTKAVDVWMAIESEEERLVFLNRILEGVHQSNLSQRIKALCEDLLKSLNSFTKTGNKNSEFIAELDRFIQLEFGGKFISMETEKGAVAISENDAVLGFTVTKEGTNSVLWPSTDSLPTDATYIESPLYLNITRTLLDSKRFPYNSVQPHIFDFAEKATLPGVVKNGNDTIVSENLKGGKFEFDNETQQLVFRKDSYAFPISNVASGLKTFGVLQLFLTNGVAHPSKFIIWDEPENHLHPEWQLNFAEILVEMAKNGYPIIVSTHSPYFIQAIRYYSALTGMEQSVDYYLAEPDGTSGLNRFRRVNDTLNEIFVKMANPLNEVMNVDLARKKFSNL
ncbi:MAG: AAA family ATPase [Bacteroides sp.]|nr:AAA family ATPase [Bacteroides sp.]